MTLLEEGLDILGRTANNSLNLALLLKHRDRLVPFVGAGLSQDFGYPDWNKLLEDLADQASLRPQIDELLRDSRFEEAAEALAAARPNLLDDTLRRIFNHHQLRRPLAQGAARWLAGIARGLVLTTNFDRVLEAAFEDAGCPFAEVLPGSRIREASYGIQFGEHFLLKLHGDYFDAASRVLTLTEYTREYGSPDPEKVNLELELPRVLRQALGAWPLLFVGCSLKNDRTTRVMAQIVKSLPGIAHFALLADSDNVQERNQQLDSWNLRPLFFPAGEYQKVGQFLEFLAQAARRLAEGEWNQVIVADVPDAKTRPLPETLAALLAAVRDPKGSLTLTSGQIQQMVREYQPREITEYLLVRIAEWSQPRYQIDRRFVHLTMLVDQGEEAQGARWAAPESRRYTNLREVLKDHAEDPALVLLGAPGSGKSTLLRRLQLDAATDTLRGGLEVVTFFLPLNAYKTDCGSPRDWVNAEWMRLYPHLPKLEALLAEGKVLLLLDALNEMPHGTRASYHHRVELWRDFIQSIAAQGNRAVFSCRRLDYSTVLSSNELRVPQVVVQAMDDAQMQTFLQAYLPSRAESIWQELRATPQLGLFCAPFFLKLLCEEVEAHGVVPKGRAGLFAGFIRQALDREIRGGNELFFLGGLLSERDHQKLALREWGNAFELPERGALIASLSGLAYAMQEKGLKTEGAQVRLAYDEACRLLRGERQQEILKAGVSLNVLDEDLRTDEILFFHQLLQEFFAARKLASNPRPELARVAWQAHAVSPSLQETLASLSSSDPLPLLPQTGWEETMLLASVMARDPADFIRGLMAVNLPLAARCLAQPELPPAPELKWQVQQALIERTQDMSADLRARIAAGLALGNLGDPRFERRAGQWGEYLLPPLKTISAGEYPIGSGEGLYENEAPPHKVRLQGFQIGMFPVTNAEYGLFIASGGYQQEQWWRTKVAKAWREGLGTSEGPMQEWRKFRKRLRGWTEEHIHNLETQNKITSKQAGDWIMTRNWTEERFEAWLEEQFPSGQRYAEPGYWKDEAFNNPSQPVVGICWHEAWAYCFWLSAQTGRTFRLPTEVEFEAAARGAAGRRYPYGGQFDAGRSNTFESHIRRTTPVGIFQNATPDGVFDLSGNVYAWTSSAYQPYPYRANDGWKGLGKTEQPWVVRGGSWLGDQYSAGGQRSVISYHPAFRYFSIGFRVVVGVASP